MSNEIILLMATAASIAFIHTLLGPDHYLPFIMMARAGKWSMAKTSWVTFWCGVGHVMSSVVLGLIGVAFALEVFKLESIESLRGDFAAWMLIVFGLSYFVWSLHRMYRGGADHCHLDASGVLTHKHDHHHTHIHKHHFMHLSKEATPWALFVIFVLGPCEPLIPLVMYPAARGNWWNLLWVVAVFGAVTIITMLTVVLSSAWGMSKIKWNVFEKYIHPISGMAIFLCGVAIKFLGL